MDVSNREDHDHGFVKVSQKEMANGELRRRAAYDNGVSVSVTTAADWLPENNLPWQDAHYHKGRTEVYTLVSGSAIFVSQEHDEFGKQGFCFHHLASPGETVTFLPNVPHIVLLGPRATIITTLFGDAVGNPERKHNDWWPADATFTEEAIAFGLHFVDTYDIFR